MPTPIFLPQKSYESILYEVEGYAFREQWSEINANSKLPVKVHREVLKAVYEAYNLDYRKHHRKDVSDIFRCIRRNHSMRDVLDYHQLLPALKRVHQTGTCPHCPVRKTHLPGFPTSLPITDPEAPHGGTAMQGEEATT